MLLLPLLLSLPVCVADRSEIELKKSQLETVAMAIEAVTPKAEERAALVTIAWFESRLCRAVHGGEKRGGLGEGLWQIEPGSRLRRPFSGLGQADTEHAASEALALWRRSWCRGQGTAARFRVYAGLGCGPSGWAGAEPRARFMGGVLRSLRTYTGKGPPERLATLGLEPHSTGGLGLTFSLPNPGQGYNEWCLVA